MMKYYRDKLTGGVFAYESDGSQDDYIDSNKIPMTDDEIHAALNPPPSTVYLANQEAQWRESEILIINNQLMALEEFEAGIEESNPLPGSRVEWLMYRSKVRAWKDGAESFPDKESRPQRP